MAAEENASESQNSLERFKPVKQGSSYVCSWKRFKRPGLMSLLRWRLFERDESNIPSPEALDKLLPVLKVNCSSLANPPEGRVQLTWIGHSSILVQFDGITILSDPLFRNFCGSELAKHLSCFGYQRYRKAACQIDDIPHLDAVIISHNHHDHLDYGSVRQIYQKFPYVTWFVPEGSRTWFRSHVYGIDLSNVVESTWWEEKILEVNKKVFRFICAPTQHWCQRRIFDFNKSLWCYLGCITEFMVPSWLYYRVYGAFLDVQSNLYKTFWTMPNWLLYTDGCLIQSLWCSWVVKGPDHSYYFVGDTGYYKPLFCKIGELYGPFSLAAIPIGTYKPRYITSYQHVSPEEAANIHEDVRSEMSVGIHWGTFDLLTTEFYLDPPREVESTLKARGLDTNTFISVQHGETWVVGEPRARSTFMATRKSSCFL